jgi:hypothetical protein
MRFNLRLHGRRIYLRGKESGCSWQIVDSWPLAESQVPERIHAQLSWKLVNRLQADLDTIRLGSYAPVAAVAHYAPDDAPTWLQCITHLCWQIRTGVIPHDQVADVVVAHRRLTDSLKVIGMKPLPQAQGSRARRAQLGKVPVPA